MKTNMGCHIKGCEEDGVFSVRRGMTSISRLCFKHVRRFVNLPKLQRECEHDFSLLLERKAKSYEGD